MSDAGTAVNTYTLCYGKPAAYELPTFSQLEVMESRDYKFQQGMIAFKADVMIGGGVAMYNGFSRVKKIAAV